MAKNQPKYQCLERKIFGPASVVQASLCNSCKGNAPKPVSKRQARMRARVYHQNFGPQAAAQAAQAGVAAAAEDQVAEVDPPAGH